MNVLKTMVDVNMTVSTSLVPLNVSKPLIIVYFMCNNTFCLQVLVQLDTLQMILIVLMRMNVWPTMDMVLVKILAPIQKAVFIVHVKVKSGKAQKQTVPKVSNYPTLRLPTITWNMTCLAI